MIEVICFCGAGRVNTRERVVGIAFILGKRENNEILKKYEILLNIRQKLVQ